MYILVDLQLAITLHTQLFTHQLYVTHHKGIMYNYYIVIIMIRPNIDILLDNHARKVISNDETQCVSIRRGQIFEDALAVFSKASTDVKKRLLVCFVGERGCDAGGPRREFFRLVLSEIFSSSLFLGWPNRVIPTNFYTGAVDHYYIAGKIIATSILQSPHCFSPPVADYLIYGEIKSETSIEDIPHIEIQESLLQVYTCSCFIDLLHIIYIHVQLVQCKSSVSIKRLVSQSEFRFLFDCGYHKSMESISTK